MFFPLKNKCLCLMIIGFSFHLLPVLSQTNFKNEADLIKRANQFFEKEEFQKAYQPYSQLLSVYPKNPQYNFRFGVCLLMSDKRDKERPIRYLEIARQTYAEEEAEVYYYLGWAYHVNYRFPEAIESYEQYKLKAKSTGIKKFDIDRKIEMCRAGMELLSAVSSLYVLERAEVRRNDFYRQYKTREFKGSFLKKPESFMTKYDKKKPGSEFIFFSDINQQVYFSSYGSKGQNGKDIFSSVKLADGSWSKPERLPEIINTPYDEDFPYMMPDGKTLFFCSNGHNSMGGYDIFLTFFDSVNGAWQKPQNVNFPINTPYDDILFVSDSAKGFAYFASERNSPYDFITVYKVGIDKSRELPENLSLAFQTGKTFSDEDYKRNLARIREKANLDVNTSNIDFEQIMAEKKKEEERKKEQAVNQDTPTPVSPEDKLVKNKISGENVKAKELSDQAFAIHRSIITDVSRLSEQKILIDKIANDKEIKANDLQNEAKYTPSAANTLLAQANLSMGQSKAARQMSLSLAKRIELKSELAVKVLNLAAEIQKYSSAQQLDSSIAFFENLQNLYLTNDSLNTKNDAVVQMLKESEVAREKAQKRFNKSKELETDAAQLTKEAEALKAEAAASKNPRQAAALREQAESYEKEASQMKESSRQEYLNWLNERAFADSISQNHVFISQLQQESFDVVLEAEKLQKTETTIINNATAKNQTQNKDSLNINKNVPPAEVALNNAKTQTEKVVSSKDTLSLPTIPKDKPPDIKQNSEALTETSNDNAQEQKQQLVTANDTSKAVVIDEKSELQRKQQEQSIAETAEKETTIKETLQLLESAKLEQKALLATSASVIKTAIQAKAELDITTSAMQKLQAERGNASESRKKEIDTDIERLNKKAATSLKTMSVAMDIHNKTTEAAQIANEIISSTDTQLIAMQKKALETSLEELKAWSEETARKLSVSQDQVLEELLLPQNAVIDELIVQKSRKDDYQTELSSLSKEKQEVQSSIASSVDLTQKQQLSGREEVLNSKIKEVQSDIDSISPLIEKLELAIVESDQKIQIAKNILTIATNPQNKPADADYRNEYANSQIIAQKLAMHKPESLFSKDFNLLDTTGSSRVITAENAVVFTEINKEERNDEVINAQENVIAVPADSLNRIAAQQKLRLEMLNELKRVNDSLTGQSDNRLTEAFQLQNTFTTKAEGYLRESATLTSLSEKLISENLPNLTTAERAAKMQTTEAYSDSAIAKQKLALHYLALARNASLTVKKEHNLNKRFTQIQENIQTADINTSAFTDSISRWKEEIPLLSNLLPGNIFLQFVETTLNDTVRSLGLQQNQFLTQAQLAETEATSLSQQALQQKREAVAINETARKQGLIKQAEAIEEQALLKRKLAQTLRQNASQIEIRIGEYKTSLEYTASVNNPPKPILVSDAELENSLTALNQLEKSVNDRELDVKRQSLEIKRINKEIEDKEVADLKAEAAKRELAENAQAVQAANITNATQQPTATSQQLNTSLTEIMPVAEPVTVIPPVAKADDPYLQSIFNAKNANLTDARLSLLERKQALITNQAERIKNAGLITDLRKKADSLRNVSANFMAETNLLQLIENEKVSTKEQDADANLASLFYYKQAEQNYNKADSLMAASLKTDNAAQKTGLISQAQEYQKTGDELLMKAVVFTSLDNQNRQLANAITRDQLLFSGNYEEVKEADAEWNRAEAEIQKADDLRRKASQLTSLEQKVALIKEAVMTERMAINRQNAALELYRKSRKDVFVDTQFIAVNTISLHLPQQPTVAKSELLTQNTQNQNKIETAQKDEKPLTNLSPVDTLKQANETQQPEIRKSDVTIAKTRIDTLPQKAVDVSRKINKDSLIAENQIINKQVTETRIEPEVTKKDTLNYQNQVTGIEVQKTEQDTIRIIPVEIKQEAPQLSKTEVIAKQPEEKKEESRVIPEIIRDTVSERGPTNTESQNIQKQTPLAKAEIINRADINKEIVREKLKENSVGMLTSNETESLRNVSIYDNAFPIPSHDNSIRGLFFKVQIAASARMVNDDYFTGLAPISTERIPNSALIRYMAGLFILYNEAVTARDRIRPLGYPDAFVVAYFNGVRISIAEARRMLEAGEAFTDSRLATAFNLTTMGQVTEAIVANVLPAKPANDTDNILITEARQGDYSVQIGVFGKPRSASQLFNAPGILSDRMANGNYRYYSGRYQTRDMAIAARNRLVTMGFTDAFVVNISSRNVSNDLQPTLIAQPETTQEQISNPEARPQTNTQRPETILQAVEFRVQIGSFSKPIGDAQMNLFLRITGMQIQTYRSSRGAYVYTSGVFSDYLLAVEFRNRIAASGIPDAFVSAFRNNVRISITEALRNP